MRGRQSRTKENSGYSYFSPHINKNVRCKSTRGLHEILVLTLLCGGWCDKLDVNMHWNIFEVYCSNMTVRHEICLCGSFDMGILRGCRGAES